MKTGCSLFFVLIILLVCSGCTDILDFVEYDEIQNDTAKGLSVDGSFTPTYFDDGSVEMLVDTSEIEIKGQPNFSPNVSSIISILLNDRRTGILLENGWNITSVSEKHDEENPARCCVNVEFRKDGLSFYIGVDEQERRTSEGYCDAEVWIGGSFSGPLSEDYHQAKDKMEGWWHVLDERNERVVMIYNKTTFLYLYPSYAIINMTGILD